MASRKHPTLDLRFSPGPGAGSLQDFLYAELDSYEPVAIQEHDSGEGWRVFFRTRADRDAAHAALRAEFRNALLELTPIDVPDDDWARRSQARLTAVTVGRIVVAPPWDTPPVERRTRAARGIERRPEPSRSVSADILVVIEPSMGFGTGHHATTRLCLELLQELDVSGRRVIDVGTGSGVLAIAAAKLEADFVLALDNDPDALANARDNVARNGVSSVEVRNADIATLQVPPADIVLANLTSTVIRRSAAALLGEVRPGGALIVSGFAPGELDDVASAFARPAERELREGEWAAARFTN